MEWLKSASKIAFLIITLTACAGFLIGRLEAKEFMILAGMAFSFYFSIKQAGSTEKKGEI